MMYSALMYEMIFPLAEAIGIFQNIAHVFDADGCQCLGVVKRTAYRIILIIGLFNVFLLQTQLWERLNLYISGRTKDKKKMSQTYDRNEAVNTLILYYKSEIHFAKQKRKQYFNQQQPTYGYEVWKLRTAVKGEI